MENEQLRCFGTISTNGGNNVNSAKVQALEKRLLSQQEELTDLHKRKGENSQMIVDLNVKLEKLTTLIVEKDAKYVFLCGYFKTFVWISKKCLFSG